jgi:hypothetical protein
MLIEEASGAVKTIRRQGMTKQGKVELTVVTVTEALEKSKPTSLSGLSVALGRSRKVSNDFKAKLVSLVPDVAARVAANKANAEVAKVELPVAKVELPVAKVETAPVVEVKPPTVEAPKGEVAVGTFTRASTNPFRAGSDYATCFDVLAANPDGIKRTDLVAAQAKATGKPEKLAGYDVVVVASVKKDGGSHRNMRRVAGVYYVDRTDAGLKLVVR